MTAVKEKGKRAAQRPGTPDSESLAVEKTQTTLSSATLKVTRTNLINGRQACRAPEPESIKRTSDDGVPWQESRHQTVPMYGCHRPPQEHAYLVLKGARRGVRTSVTTACPAGPGRDTGSRKLSGKRVSSNADIDGIPGSSCHGERRERGEDNNRGRLTPLELSDSDSIELELEVEARHHIRYILQK